MLPLCRQILQADTQTYCNGVIDLWRTGWGAISCYPEGYWEAPISTHKTPAIISMMQKHIKSVRGSLKRKRLIIAASATPAAAQMPYATPRPIPELSVKLSMVNATR